VHRRARHAWRSFPDCPECRGQFVDLGAKVVGHGESLRGQDFARQPERAYLDDADGAFVDQNQLDTACGKPKALPPGLILDSANELGEGRSAITALSRYLLNKLLQQHSCCLRVC
jgi:hypothetical protein